MGSGVSDAALQMIDATIIRAHHCAAGGKGGAERNALGRSRGGFSTKINARTDAEGLPIRVVICAITLMLASGVAVLLMWNFQR